MDDPGDSPSPPETGDSISSFLHSFRGVISTTAALVIAIGGLITALNQVGLLDGDDPAPLDPVTSVTPPPPPPNPVFADATGRNGRLYFDGKAIYVEASRIGRPYEHPANPARDLADVSMRVRVTRVSGSRDFAFGLICRRRDGKNYYVLSILSGGRYNVLAYKRGKRKSLVRSPRRGFGWGAPFTKGPNRLFVKCLGKNPTLLTLKLNGRELPTLPDEDGIASGNVGIRVGTGVAADVIFRFDDFRLGKL